MVYMPLEKNHFIYHAYEDLLIGAIYSSYHNIWIGKVRFLYGYRLRSGFLDDTAGCNLDICCGPLPKYYNDLLLKVRSIIMRNPLHDPFREIPNRSLIKPYYNDIDFCNTIDELYSHCSVFI